MTTVCVAFLPPPSASSHAHTHWQRTWAKHMAWPDISLKTRNYTMRLAEQQTVQLNLILIHWWHEHIVGNLGFHFVFSTTNVRQIRNNITNWRCCSFEVVLMRQRCHWLFVKVTIECWSKNLMEQWHLCSQQPPPDFSPLLQILNTRYMSTNDWLIYWLLSCKIII